VVALAVVLPASAAILPDPLWIGGIYDGGDADDLIAASADLHAAGMILPLLDGSAASCLIHLGDDGGFLTEVYRPCRPRAPPPTPGNRAVPP
jgi:hypothetical protein